MFALAWKVKSRISLPLVPSSRTSKATNCSRSMHRWTTIFPAFLYPSSSVHGCTITVAEISRTVSFFVIFSFSRGRYFFRYMSITVTTIYKRFLAVGTYMSLFRFLAHVSDVPSQWASSFRGDAIADRASCWTSLSIASMYFMILEIKKNHLSINMLWGRCCDGSQRKWRLSSQKNSFLLLTALNVKYFLF